MSVVIDELLDLERRFTAAIVANDAAALREFVADDWVIIEGGGRVVPREVFLGIIEAGVLTHDSMANDDVAVRLFGECAIVSGVARTQGAYHGHAFALHERFSDVFVRQDGRWRCVLTQLTTIAEG